MAKSSIALVLAAVFATSCAAPGSGALPQYSSQQVQVVDDPMNVFVMVVGPKIRQERQGFLDTMTFTLQLGAGIVRKTGRTEYFVRSEVEHSSGSWLFFTGAVYLDANGEPKPGLGWQRAKGEVEYCSGGSCRYSEGGTFNVPAAELLRQAGVGAVADGKGWRIRINSEKGFLDGYIPKASIPYFVAEVERVQLRVAKAAVDRLASNPQ